MNYYLCPVQDQAITVKKLYLLNELLPIGYPPDVLLPFKVDEHIFLLQYLEGYLLPYGFSIATINRATRTLVLRVTNMYQSVLPLAALSILLPEHMLGNYVQLTSHQLEAIISLMNIFPQNRPSDFLLERDKQKEAKSQELLIRGLDKLTAILQESQENSVAVQDLLAQNLDKLTAILQVANAQITSITQNSQTILQERAASFPIEEEAEKFWWEEPEPDNEDDSGEIFEETEVLDYVKDYIRRRGYYFEDETLYNYHICLKTRPFVILAGLSGTGKSKLAQLYAEALGQDGTFKRLPVRPNWNDDRYLLGHLNTVTGEYITEPAIDFILAAIANQKKLYSLCLDEMNIAHVEYYFSQFLSAMEGDSPKDRRISLMSQRAFEQIQRQHRAHGKKFWPPEAEIHLPDNLIFTGTINVDETTQPISDKVIDRANTIEFFNVDLDSLPEPRDAGEALLITNRAWQSYRATKPDTRYRSQIVEINKILKGFDMGLGYRVVHEIELYLANSQALLEPQVAFDLQCKQRILPRIHGTEFIESMLSDLITFSKKNKLARTEQRLQEMKSRLKRDGYTSFWR